MSGHRLIITPGSVLESVQQQEDSKTGFRTIYTFTGSESVIDAQRIVSRLAGAKTIDKSSSGDGNYKLVCTFPFDAEDNGNGDAEVPTDTHELESSMAQQDVFLNPKLCRTPPDGDAGVSQTNRHILKAHVDKYKHGAFDTVEAAEKAILDAVVNDGLLTVSHAAMKLRVLAYFREIALHGVEHWVFYRTVYSRTITSATPRQVQASFYGSQKLITTAQLLALENVPSDWWFTLPPNYVWHKSEPTVRTDIGRGRKTQITYRYIASQEASAMLYDTI